VTDAERSDATLAADILNIEDCHGSIDNEKILHYHATQIFW
jgi:hypothetical protein